MPHCPAVSIMDTSGLKGSFEISNLSASWSLNQAEGLICDVGEGRECKQTALPMCRRPTPPGEGLMKVRWSFKGPWFCPNAQTSISVASEFLTHSVCPG